MPTAAPLMNPARRPTRRIHWEAGMVESATPTMYVLTGSVARALFPASEWPTRPASAMTDTLTVSRIA